MRMHRFYLLFFFIIVCLTSCSPPVPTLKPLSKDSTILAFGDSLTYGTGTTKQYSYPVVLQNITGFRVINAGVPGEETQDALKRLPDLLLKYHPALVIICLGGNDMLRKRRAAFIRSNLERLVGMVKQSGAEVVLVAAPQPNLTLSVPDFYAEIAKKYQIPLAKNILSELLKERRYKSDAIHLNKAGYRLFAEKIAALLRQSGAI